MQQRDRHEPAGRVVTDVVPLWRVVEVDSVRRAADVQVENIARLVVFDVVESRVGNRDAPGNLRRRNAVTIQPRPAS
jgi:hypothetical protein